MQENTICVPQKIVTGGPDGPTIFWTIDQLLNASRFLPELKSMTTAAFRSWLVENKSIYGYFRKFAIEAVNANRKRFSIYTVRERVRWYTTVEWKGEFKVSNNVTPYVARLLLMEFPIMEDMLSIKGAKKKAEYGDE